MPTPAITPALRFMRSGTGKCYFVPTIAAATKIPTRLELNAGTDISGDINAFSGWMVQSGFIDAPDYGSRFVSKIPGRINADDSSVTMYESSNNVDSRSLLPRDTSGYLVFMDGGDVAGQKMDIFPIKVGSNTAQRSVDDEPALREITFAVTSVPVENATIPA